MVEWFHEVNKHLTQKENQLPMLFKQIQSWVQTNLEASKTKFKRRMMETIEEYKRELHVCIDNFETWISSYLYEV